MSTQKFVTDAELYGNKKFWDVSVTNQNLMEITDRNWDNANYWKINHDSWSAYTYGNLVKITYFKCGGQGTKKKPIKIKSPSGDDGFEKAKSRFKQSLSRSRARVFELAMCNEFSYFCTFTQSDEKRDRFDLFSFRKDFAQFVRNENRNRTDVRKIKYLLIPERHKDGAWHMHGLLFGLDESDLKRNYNGYKDWLKYSYKFGYFSVSKIKNPVACAKYITKYVTKEFKNLVKNERDVGDHLYYASQGLTHRECVSPISDEFNCPVEKWDFENDYIKTAWIDLNEINSK